MEQEKITHVVRIYNPITRETTEVFFTKRELQSMIRDTIFDCVVASSAIEGIDLSKTTPPDPSMVPECFLTT